MHRVETRNLVLATRQGFTCPRSTSAISFALALITEKLPSLSTVGIVRERLTHPVSFTKRFTLRLEFRHSQQRLHKRLRRTAPRVPPCTVSRWPRRSARPFALCQTTESQTSLSKRSPGAGTRLTKQLVVVLQLLMQPSSTPVIL